MAYGRRRRGRYGRRYRRRFGRRRLARRHFRRYRRRARGTKSAIIKLTFDGVWQFRIGAGQAGNTGNSNPVYQPFSFPVTAIPGFTDYLDTYTRFRILKAQLYVGRSVAYSGGGTGNSNALTNNYLIVGSRPFANVQSALLTSTVPATTNLVPAQVEDSLRQTKWQKVKYPSTTRTAIRIGFYPYTLITTGGPAWEVGNQYQYQRIWEARRWMPITWAGAGQSLGTGATSSLQGRSLTFYGPYMVCDLQATGTDSSNAGEFTPNMNLTSNVQLVVRVQFSGQR